MTNIPTAKIFGGKITEEYDNSGTRAEERGLRANQHGRAAADVNMDTSWRDRGLNTRPTEGTGTVQAKEEQENVLTRQMQQRIAEIVSEGQAPMSPYQRYTQPQNRRGANLNFTDLLTERDQTGPEPFVDPMEMGHPQQVREAQQDVVPQGAWVVDEMTARTKAGASVLVWQVRDSQSGMTHPHRFRLAETAARVKAVLNRSGNANDPRVKQWIAMDTQRVGLIGKVRQLKEAVRAGNTGVKTQLSQLQEQLAELDLKIGV